MFRPLCSAWMSALFLTSLAILMTAPAGVASSQDVAAAPAGARGGPGSADQRGSPLDRPAALSIHEAPLVRALTRLSEAAEVEVAFSPSLITRHELSVTCRCVGRTVGEALDRLLAGTPFTYTEVLNQVFVHLRENAVPVWEPVMARSESAQRAAGLLNASMLLSSPVPARALREASVPVQGTVAGMVTHAETGEPVAAVQLSIIGTQLGALSGGDGTFTIQNVPAGTHALLAQRLGFQTLREEAVAVTTGGTTSLQLVLTPAVLALQEIVATGLVDPVQGVRSPVSIARVTREQMPVPVAGGALQNLQGRVAGLSMARSSGQPGSEVSIMLRTPTTVRVDAGAAGLPLLVVDGVILGTGGTANIESMDIESIEVIRGAAAASLYGSRAAAGVIAISTARGQGLAMGQTQFSARSEMGLSQINRKTPVPTHHHYLMDDARTTYVDVNGAAVGRNDRVALPNAYMDNPYPTPIYDNLGAVFQPGGFSAHNFSVSQNTADTNFAMTLNRYSESGALENNDGYQRNSFRVNLDHRFLDGVSLGTSVYHGRDIRDDIDVNFTTILRAPVDQDLRQKDETGSYIRIPDPQAPYENPLWRQASREGDRRRIRTLASGNIRWEPTSWLSFMGNVSYDRQDSKNRSYLPKGTPTSLTTDDESDGSISFSSSFSDTWNTEAQTSLRRDFGLLNTRTTLRMLVETDRNEAHASSASDFFVQGVPRINVGQNRNSTSSESETRSVGYLWDTAFDYDAKYIATVLVRRDGSSVFGPDNRWHQYYRTAFAYRISEADWFQVRGVDEFKLSYARGTAGGRPGFDLQYETWSVGATGVSKSTLGNRELRPEHTLEQELSLNMILLQRYGIELNYAWQKTTDQLVNASVPAFTGYSSQWTNGGSVEGRSIELTVEAQVIQTPAFNWNTMLVADRSHGWITEWPHPCTTVSYRYYCGEERGVNGGMYKQWAGLYLTKPHQLDDHHGGAAGGRKDEFMVNDDGFLVWVGSGNHYTDELWGTTTNIEGIVYRWGIPFTLSDPGGERRRAVIGDGNHMNIGSINTFRFRQLAVHSHLHAALGGTTINDGHRALALTNHAPQMDQAGKPDGLKKPIEYYHAQNPPGSAFVQPRTYLKLRTLSLSYNLNPAQITRLRLGNVGIQSANIGLIGRDLFLLTNYLAFDPEQGLNFQTRSGGAGNDYPSTRTLTAEVQITF